MPLFCPHCDHQQRDSRALQTHLEKVHPTKYQPLPAPGASNPSPAGSAVRVYLRVSTDEQTNLNQLLKVKAWLGAAKGIDSFTVYEDTESGAKEDRPGLTRLLLDLRRGDLVVITRVDRLSRSLKHLVQVMDYCRDVGADILATEQPIDTTGPMGRAFWQVLGVFAELERALIIARTRDGHARNRALGKPNGRHKAGCGLLFPCPWGLDHSPEGIARRRAEKRGRKAAMGHTGTPLPSESGPAAQGA